MSFGQKPMFFQTSQPTVVPSIETHKSTLVFLHPRGTLASTFSISFLSIPLPNSLSLAQSLPNTKFVFPQAPYLPATAATGQNTAPVSEWFYLYSIASPSLHPEMQKEGLRSTVLMLRGLIKEEAKKTGLKNVVLGGFSQGCAAALVALLCWEGEPLGGFVGLSGWLPAAGVIEDMNAESNTKKVGDNGSKRTNPMVRIQKYFGLEPDGAASDPSALPNALHTPMFLGHGYYDAVISVDLGWRTSRILKDLGLRVRWKDYLGQRHEVGKEELQDVVAFLQGCLPPDG